MSVTDNSYHYYLKRDDTGLKIGIINNDGDAVDSGMTLKVYYTKLPSEILTINDSFQVPEGFKLGFIKGVVAEIAATYPENDISVERRLAKFERSYKEAMGSLNAKTKRDTQLPKVIAPLDMRYQN